MNPEKPMRSLPQIASGPGRESARSTASPRLLLTVLCGALALTALLATVPTRSSAQQPVSVQTATQGAPAQPSPEEIIRQFTTKESELREVWKEYSYQQESRLQVIGPANTISGEYYQVSEFVFNDAGTRLEKIIKAPPSTLDRAGLIMTQEDKNAFINLQPFALAAEDLPNYSVSFVGKEKIDEIDTYVFDVTPRIMANRRELNRLKDKRIEGIYFMGRIWVDEVDLMIVKTAGKIVPEFKQRFAKFETYRENIDGKFWFPTYTYGDDTLEFDRFRVRVRMQIKYRNYRRFQSDVRITGVDELIEDLPEEESKEGAPAPEAGKPRPSANPPKPEKPKRPRL
ncbi:MAG: hypothetical protein ACOYNR_11750 [Blastocatellia bacterium]|jgi:hypothetical protein